jgi:tetratricopeptide (TPR) repeat protein
MSRLLATGLLITLAAVPVRAQSADSAAHRLDSAAVPARPKLDAGVDTNSAQANYEYGMKRIDDDPQESVRAFYWASRIDPTSGDAMYALWTAKLVAMSDPQLASYLGHGRSHEKRTGEQLELDSLIYRAYVVNPFLFSSLDRALMKRTIEAEIGTLNPKMKPALKAQAVAREVHAAAAQPSIAYSQGRFQEALDSYAFELYASKLFGEPPARKKPNAKEKQYAEIVKVGLAFERVDLHAKRARIFFQLHELDSATTEMTAAISILQAQDSGSFQPIYLSKAIFDESLGIIYEHDRRFDLAREAYGRALQEDLSFYAAHNRLAGLELELGDTTNALTDIDLAVQLEPRDPALRYRYAKVLVSARRDAEAAQQLIRAIALDPYYGSPRLMLAMMSDVESYTDDAIAEYKAYIALAARSEPQLPRIKARLAKLTEGLASTQSH